MANRRSGYGENGVLCRFLLTGAKIRDRIRQKHSAPKENEMKKRIWCVSLLALFPLLLSGCFLFQSYVYVSLQEIRTGLIGMNVIGIVGPPEAEVEIMYSTAVEDTGENETISRRISLPYVFRDNRVYITYLYTEYSSSIDSRPTFFYSDLIRNFEKGSAEYLTLINHSPEYEIKFFITDAPDIFAARNFPPNITYRDTPLYYLLFPERNPSGSSIEPWTAEKVAELYRKEFARSELVQLSLHLHTGGLRMIDLVEGREQGLDSFRGAVFYGTIEPEGRFQANERVWLLALHFMFSKSFGSGLF